MAGWISALLAALVVGVAVIHPEPGAYFRAHMSENMFAYPAILLFSALLAYAVAHKSPRWSAARQTGEWASMFAAAVVILANLHLLPAYVSQENAPAAAPAPQEARPAPEPAKDKAAGKRHEDKRSARRRPAGEPPRIEDDDPLPPDAPRKVLVRDANGEEYFYELNPGEKMPADLTNLDALAKGAWTQIDGDRRGHFIVTARINNQPVKVLVDTGASAVALSHEDARRAGVHTFALKYTLPVSTANGVVKAAPVTLRRVEINGVVVRDVKAWVMPRGAMRGTLLGMSFLSRLSSFGMKNGKLVLKQ